MLLSSDASSKILKFKLPFISLGVESLCDDVVSECQSVSWE